VEPTATKPDPPFLAPALLAALSVSAWQVQTALPLNHDVGWLMIGARRLLETGGLSAERFVDVTPPLILALYALPVAVAGALGVSEIAALRIFVIGLAGASLCLCHLAASRLFGGEASAQVRSWLVVVAGVLLPLVGYDFAQREHVITLLLLPYLVGAAARAHAADPPRGIAVWTGVAAGLAIGMKPQYALVVLAAEAAVWRRRGRAGPGVELGGLAATVALAAAWTVWRVPDYLRVTLPLVWETYDAYHSPLRDLVLWYDPPLLGAAILVALRLPRGGAARDLARILAAAAVAAYAAYLAGRTDFDYHRQPFLVFAIATLALPLLRALSWGGIVAAVVFGVGVASLWIAPLDVHDARRAGREWPGWIQGAVTTDILRSVESGGRGGPFFLFASSVADAFPAVNYAGVDWASRFSCLWLLPAVIRARAESGGAIPEARRQRLDEIERYVVDAVIVDLERARPELVFVPHVQQHQAFGGIDFDFLAYFERDRRFARFWSGYELRDDTPFYRVYAPRQP
jgi:hypothetical protein